MTGDETESALIALHRAGLLERCSLKEYRTLRANQSRFALSLRTPTEVHLLKSTDDLQSLLGEDGTQWKPSSRSSGIES